MERYDAIVIGTGQAGKPLAHDLAEAGWRVAVVERADVGGTCVNVGCTPTKTMVASARVAYLAGRAADYGVDLGGVAVDMERVRQRKREVVDDFSGGSQRRLEATDNLDLIFGEAQFTARDAVRVRVEGGDARELMAPRVFINAGCRPFVPPIEGLTDSPFLDSTTVMELGDVPEHLLVLGGGYIGLEFGQMFRRFGSEVTVIHRGAQLLSREDADVAEAVADILREDGIEILLESTVTGVHGSAGNGVEATLSTPEGDRTARGSHLLVAVGRTPNSDALNLAAAGVEVNGRGHIPVNERLETNVPGIWALGDINGGPAFTHIAYDDYRVARANLLGDGAATTAGRLTPYTVYIDPQFARVGLSEGDAAREGRDVRVAKLPMDYVARAIEMDETRGFMKAIVEAQTDRILGCAVLGVEGGEIMSTLQMAMLGDMPYTALRDAIFAHPTLAEALNNLFASLDG
ncbi:mercuric reductase [Candidatus Poribacteria bacterium]|nr:mercuric reductase [Candidatus Poribacteria bacterium]MBT5537078.1 mercuric reductase [Candidatus Poribacteria bacterium]MBT7096195.1 mercuric reductase [Candidatus Poribacteria bacterium]MBT7805345.1 mercuric reductase [Candidatus Poribacteria bacterium]